MNIVKQFLIVFFICACGWAYHYALTFSASLIKWEGTAIAFSLIGLALGFLFGLLFNWRDEYKDNRIKGLEDQQKADQDIIATLQQELDNLRKYVPEEVK